MVPTILKQNEPKSKLIIQNLNQIAAILSKLFEIWMPFKIQMQSTICIPKTFGLQAPTELHNTLHYLKLGDGH